MQQILIINRLYSVFYHLPSALYICRESSTNQTFFTKQTQFPKTQNELKCLFKNILQQ